MAEQRYEVRRWLPENDTADGEHQLVEVFQGLTWDAADTTMVHSIDAGYIVDWNRMESTTYALEVTDPGVAYDCRSTDCAEHYVVRDGGLWVRAFHNERDAREYVEGGSR